MDDFKGIKGLTAADRQQWEQIHLDRLKGVGWDSFSEADKQRFFELTLYYDITKSNPDLLKYENNIINDEAFRKQALESYYSSKNNKDSISTNINNDDTQDNSNNSYVLNANIPDYLKNPNYADPSVANANSQQSGLLDHWTNPNMTIKSVAHANSSFDVGQWLDEVEAAKQAHSKGDIDWYTFDTYAKKYSDYYKRYAGSDYLPLDYNTKNELLNTYREDIKNNGLEQANKNLGVWLNDKIANNQRWYDKVGNAIGGFGSSVVGGILGQIGFWYGLLVPGVDTVDNTVTRYADLVTKQGTLAVNFDNPDKQRYEILRDSESKENGFWDLNTLAELPAMGGYTVASMAGGGAASKGVKRLSWLAKRSPEVIKAFKAGNKAQLATKLNKINKIERASQAIFVPGLVGTYEGATNALQAKMQFEGESEQLITNAKNQFINQYIYEQMPNATFADEEAIKALYKEAEELFKPYEEAFAERAEGDADTVALNSLILESAVNGFINIGFQHTMFGPRTKEAFAKTKLGKHIYSPKVNVDINTGTVPATSESLLKNGYKVAKEPVGEFLEEYFQYIEAEGTVAGGMADMTDFISLAYDGNSLDGIKTDISDQFGAAFNAFYNSAISREAFEAGLYGLAGSLTGTSNVHALFSKSEWQKFGEKSFGEKIQHFYRNPIIESIQEINEDKKAADEMANALTQYFQADEGRNLEKMKSSVALASWMQKMNSAVENGDEFNYRNSRLGLYIQDFYTLEALKGTPIYESYFQSINKLANMDVDSQEAKELEEQTGQSASTIKENAKQLKQIAVDIEAATKELESVLGEQVPENLKRTLIFGRLSIEDWTNRLNKVNKEVGQAVLLSDSNNTNSSGHTQNEYVAKFGNNIEAGRNPFEEALLKARIDVDVLKQASSLNKAGYQKRLKAAEKEYKRILKEHNKYQKEFSKIFPEDTKSLVLTEADIMSMDTSLRAEMLDPKNLNRYSEEQQRIITDLINKATVNDPNFLSKVQDAAKLDAHINKFVNQYNEFLTDPSKIIEAEQRILISNQIDDTIKEGESFKEIEDYKEFSKKLDSVFNRFKDNPLGSSILEGVIKDLPHYSRYQSDRKRADRFSKHIESNSKFKELSEGDKQLLYEIVLDIMRDETIDIENADITTAVLDRAINTRIDVINENLSANEKITIQDLEHLIPVIQEGLQSFFGNEITNENLKAEPKAVSLEENGTQDVQDAQTTSESESDTNSLNAEEKTEDRINETKTEIISLLEKETKKLLDTYKGEKTEEEIASIESDLKAIKSEIERLYQQYPDLRDAELDDFLNTKYSNARNDEEKFIINSVIKKVRERMSDDSNDTSKSFTKKSDYTFSVTKVSDDTSNSVQARLNSYSIDDYINNPIGKNGETKLDLALSKTGRTIEFIYDPTLEVETRNSLGDKYNPTNDLPILIVIKDSTNNTNGIKIGKDTYQVLGVLPSSISRLSGRTNAIAKVIREQAIKSNKIEGIRFVAKGNSRLQAKFAGVKGGNKVSHSEETDTQLLDLYKEKVTEAESDLSSTNIFLSLPQVTSSQDKFFNRFKWEKDENGKSQLTYTDDGGNTRYVLINSPLSTKVDGVSLPEVLKSNNYQNIINFNSRTKGFVSRIRKLFDTVDGGKVDDNYLKNVAEHLNNEVHLSGGKYVFKESPKTNTLKLFIETSAGTLIELGTISRNYGSGNITVFTDEDAAKVLQNLFTDPRISENAVGVNFQVSDNEWNRSYAEKAIKDGILRVSISNETSRNVTFYMPQVLVEVKAVPKEIVSNPENASSTEGPLESTQIESEDTSTESAESVENKSETTIENQEAKQLEEEQKTICQTDHSSVDDMNFDDLLL